MWIVFLMDLRGWGRGHTNWVPGMRLTPLCILFISSVPYNMGRYWWAEGIISPILQASRLLLCRPLLKQPLIQWLPNGFPLRLIKLPVTGTCLPFQLHLPSPLPLCTTPCSSCKTLYQVNQTWELFVHASLPWKCLYFLAIDLHLENAHPISSSCQLSTHLASLPWFLLLSTELGYVGFLGISIILCGHTSNADSTTYHNYFFHFTMSFLRAGIKSLNP